MEINLTKFDLGAMLRCGTAIREVTREVASLEEGADRVVRLFNESCIVPESGERALALARFYKTQAFADMDVELQTFARARLGSRESSQQMRCLVLVASAGQEPEWNDPRKSKQHRTIPLPSADIVRQAPMIAALIDQLGLDLQQVVQPARQLLPSLEGKTYNVFHVEEALGSPFIPAQEAFVQRYGIRSVVGFGGMLRSGNLFTVILFSRVSIPGESARRFRNTALDVKSALFQLDERRATPRV